MATCPYTAYFRQGPGSQQLSLKDLPPKLRPVLLSCWKYRPAPCPTGPGARKDMGMARVAVVLSLRAPEVRHLPNPG